MVMRLLKVIFTMEYCLRLALCHTDPRYGSSFISRTFHYAVPCKTSTPLESFQQSFCLGSKPQVQPLNLVDVIAVLPFYLKLVMDTSQIGVFGTSPQGFRVTLQLCEVHLG